MTLLKLSMKKLVPTECIFCKALDNHTISNLCYCCEKQLPYLQNYCFLCALPLFNEFNEEVANEETANKEPSSETVCGSCLSNKPSYDESYCALKYQSPISSFISQAKHHQQLIYLSTLSEIFRQGYYGYKHPRHRIKPDVITAIPLSTQRQFSRGFNQSQTLASLISKSLGIPMANHLLKRTQHATPQQGLSRKQRMQNIKNSFVSSSEIDGKNEAEGLNIALIDDVITTGATMEAAASALKKAGAKSVLAWGIARTA